MPKTYNNLYSQICNMSNLLLAYRKARKGKSKKPYVIEFERDTIGNLFKLQKELIEQTYSPKPLVTFILRDPKTRRISKSAFIDRIVHHALVRIIEPIFDKTFIYDSCANRKAKGNLFALKRFDYFKRKVTNNLHSEAFCLKADIKHYFQEVNHERLLDIIKGKIKDKKVIWLIEKILKNHDLNEICDFSKKGMPLGNLTSQFFANVYLNELDYFVKHKLKTKYYIRYVDDFVILYKSKSQLEIWKKEINEFLRYNLKLELHPQKSRIIPLSKGIDFVGFRNFYYYRLLRRRNINNMKNKVISFRNNEILYEKFIQSFRGWYAYAKWADSFKLVKETIKMIYN
jgi:RNA-directed DNA polymerase